MHRTLPRTLMFSSLCILCRILTFLISIGWICFNHTGEQTRYTVVGTVVLSVALLLLVLSYTYGDSSGSSFVEFCTLPLRLIFSLVLPIVKWVVHNLQNVMQYITKRGERTGTPPPPAPMQVSLMDIRSEGYVSSVYFRT